MSPRSYQSDKRQAAARQTRLRILTAARTLLAGATVTQVSVDTVAKAADVSRQTIYNTFGSKPGLLEALFDSLAEQGGMSLEAAFGTADERAAVTGFVEVFCGFWASERLVIRRLRGMAALDPDLERLLGERDEMRRAALRSLLQRFGYAADAGEIDVVWQLTSFETFHALAGERDTAEVARQLSDAALAVLKAA